MTERFVFSVAGKEKRKLRDLIFKAMIRLGFEWISTTTYEWEGESLEYSQDIIDRIWKIGLAKEIDATIKMITLTCNGYVLYKGK